MTTATAEPSEREDQGAAWRRNLRGETGLAGPRPASWWTGLAPVRGVCPGVGEDGVLRSLPLPDLSVATRDDLLAYFENGWTLTELLFSALQGEEAFFRPPRHRLRHPLVFYYAHPAALFVNKLRVAGLADAPLDAAYEQLFETGVDEMSWDDLSKNDMEWPRVADVTEYRRRVHALVRRVLETHPDAAPGRITMDHPLWAALMGMEHERIHLETSSVLVRELPERLLLRPREWPPEPPAGDAAPSLVPPEGAAAQPPARWVGVAPGEAVLGKPRAWPTFGWDDEYGERRVRVGAFAAQDRLVTNADVYAFVVAGGYAEPRWWTDDGWRWRTFRNAKRPWFWVPTGPAGLHRYRLRRQFDVGDMPWRAPAVVNHHEAKAYAAWRAAEDGSAVPYRLLTEAEHHLIRERGVTHPEDGRRVDLATCCAGEVMTSRHGVNLALAWGGESATDAAPPDRLGFRDVVGNVWQWAEDHVAALPGFRPHPYYDDFSTPCFDGEHNLILGGSFVSTGTQASVFLRTHFRRHFQQHAGFRLARSAEADALVETSCMDAPPPHVGAGPCCSRDGRRGRTRESGYESDAARDAYLLMHFGTAEETFGGVPGPHDAVGFAQRCARRLAAWRTESGLRALDVGCGVGGAAFELARTYGEVVGVDLSASFIAAANALRDDGELAYRRRDEGERTTQLLARVDPSIDRSRVTFRRGDACALPADLGAFDAVVVANLLCRLPSPKALLSRLGGPRGLVRPGGLLLVTTPATWREEFTPRAAWLGGRDGVATFDGLRRELGDEFSLLWLGDEPFVLREHARKFEYVVAQASVWRRRS